MPGILGTQGRGGESTRPPSGPQGPCGDAAPGSRDESSSVPLRTHFLGRAVQSCPCQGRGRGCLGPPVDGQGLTTPWFVLVYLAMCPSW